MSLHKIILPIDVASPVIFTFLSENYHSFSNHPVNVKNYYFDKFALFPTHYSQHYTRTWCCSDGESEFTVLLFGFFSHFKKLFLTSH